MIFFYDGMLEYRTELAEEPPEKMPLEVFNDCCLIRGVVGSRVLLSDYFAEGGTHISDQNGGSECSSPRFLK